MKHIFRFFGQRISEKKWQISEEDTIHLTKVLRLKSQEVIELFDGYGHLAVGHISAVIGKNVIFECESETFVQKSVHTSALAIGALKPGFIDEMLPCLIELDLDEIHVFSQQSVEKFRTNEKVQNRWDKIIVNSCKQCKRLYLPQIFVWSSVEEMLTSRKFLQFHHKLLLLPESTETLISQNISNTNVMAIIGGEKGFSDCELSQLSLAGCKNVSMGTSILRAYTAGIAVATILSVQTKNIT